jgi:hypothetical protein
MACDRAQRLAVSVPPAQRFGQALGVDATLRVDSIFDPDATDELARRSDPEVEPDHRMPTLSPNRVSPRPGAGRRT